MINRVLIRIKVVQILYSYMLTRSEFKIDSAPETTSRDRRYAYTVYLTTLLALLELSGYSSSKDRQAPIVDGTDANSYLHYSAMARALATDDTIRKTILRDQNDLSTFTNVLSTLYKQIINSSVYRSYTHKKKRELTDDVTFWATVMQTVVGSSEAYQELIRKAYPDFSLKGYEAGIQKVVDTLNTYHDNKSMLREAASSLQRSLSQAYELYHLLLRLPVSLTRIEEERIEEGRNKYLPTPEDLNPNTRFVDNAFVHAISGNEAMQAYFQANPPRLDWEADPMMLRRMLDHVRQSDLYREYMEAPETDYQKDCDFWRNVMKTVILPGDDLAEALESNSIYWNDDLDIMGTFVLKTIKRFSRSDNPEQMELLPKYKDEEDERFGGELFRLVVDNADTYRSYIDRFINPRQWDTERLAFMDIIVMMTAIAEMLNFPLIPLAVTLNEYIEIANSYSTDKSGQFVNGILSSVIGYLQGEGLLHKLLSDGKTEI